MACNSELIASEATTKLQTLAHMKANPSVGLTVRDSKQEEIDFGDRKLYLFSNRLAGSYGSLFIYDDKSRILFSGDFYTPWYDWDSKVRYR